MRGVAASSWCSRDAAPKGDETETVAAPDDRHGSPPLGTTTVSCVGVAAVTVAATPAIVTTFCAGSVEKPVPVIVVTVPGASVDGATLATGQYRPVTPEGEHANRLLTFRRGEGAVARTVVVPRLTGGLGTGAPIGARWGDTRLRLEDEGVASWRCLLSGVIVPTLDGSLAASAVLAELPVALLAPARSV